MKYPEVLEQVADYVRKYMQQHDNPAFLYHNLQHTESIVAAANQISQHYALNERDQFVTITAAWFHDLGFFDDIHNHEAAGANLAGAFLEKAGIEEDIISAVKKCILATKMPQSATSLPEQIVCDADLFNLGTDDFVERGKLLRKEYNMIQNTPLSKADWRNKTIHLLENHRYYTEYCRTLLEEKKAQNLIELRKKTAEQQLLANTEKSMSGEHNAHNNPYEEVRKKKKYEGPERTIETMFRVTSTNSQRLSDQADTKAHILITVNSIIVSVLLTVFVRKDNDYSNIAMHLGIIAIPLGLLLIVNLVTIVFSILATRPNIPNGTFTPTDLKNRSANLLFFGNFYRMKFNDYSAGMFQIMKDKNYLHTTLLRDIYHQGVVLGRKYRLLKTAYNVFMYGLILAVLTFFIAVSFHRNEEPGNNSGSTETGYTLPYRLNQPDTVFDLPPALREISGLSFSPDGRQLLAVNDEKGLLFFLNPETGAIERSLNFGEKGDYEGVEAVGNDVYVVKSNGTLYRIHDTGAIETLKTSLTADYDVEGLGYDPGQHRLLLACKGQAGNGEQFKHKKAVYAYNLTTQRLDETPAFLIDRAEIARWKDPHPGFANRVSDFFSSNKSASAFNPSGIAVCMQDSNLYLIASAGKTLAVLRPNGQLAYACRLDSGLFHQPEGICFDHTGRLYISSEGGKSAGRIMRFTRNL